jgi:two-component system, NtrC family, response regulator AtoC
MAKLLVVDDQPVLKDRLITIASQGGHTVNSAGDLEGALDLIRTKDFDLIVTDLRLRGGEGEDGLEVLKAAKERNIYTQVIVITSLGNAELKARAMDLGAFTYLQRDPPTRVFQVKLAQTIKEALEFRETMMSSN